MAPWNLHAHASPICILKGNRPIQVASDTTAMADYVRMIMEVYRRKGNFASNQQWEELMTNCRNALAFYEGMLR